MHFLLIDYENIQPDIRDLDLPPGTVCVYFVGVMQRPPVQAVRDEMAEMGYAFEVINACLTGPNALDFHIASYMGALLERQPDAHITVLSRDNGFDSLIMSFANAGKSVIRIPRGFMQIQTEGRDFAAQVQIRRNSKPVHVEPLCFNGEDFHVLMSTRIAEDQVKSMAERFGLLALDEPRFGPRPPEDFPSVDEGILATSLENLVWNGDMESESATRDVKTTPVYMRGQGNSIQQPRKTY